MEEKIASNSFKAWMLAARPKTLTGAAIPVLLAGALAIHDSTFRVVPWLGCLLFAFLMQIDANFINDLYDYKKGTDREDRLGPERACSQGWISPEAMLRGIIVVSATASIVGLLTVASVWQLLPYRGLEFVVVGILCLAFAVLYTTVFSYRGWGDALVLIFFGLIPVCGTYYLMAQSIPSTALTSGFISGIAIDALLVINNYRDRDQDRISGKRTLVVRYGEKFGELHYLGIGIAVGLLILLLPFLSDEPIGAKTLFYLIPITIYGSMHLRTWRQMIATNHGKALNIYLGQTSRNMFIMAILLAAAMIF